MYRQHKKSTKLTIQGIDLYVPPAGVVFNAISGKWEERPIFKRSAKKSEQYWERPQPPEDFDTKLRKERIAKKTNPSHYDPELREYRNQEWDRRLNGFWFYNNGIPTYVTGLHYFYLVHWKIDVGYPSFRITDMEWFYFMDYCIQDPYSMGMVEVTKRRQGKTMRGGAFLFDLPSRSKNKNAGIQSKTLDDAKDNVFAKAVIMPFKYLADFFVPIYDTEKGKTPKGELRFFKTNKRGAQEEEDVDKVELESMITFKNSGKFAYDGTKLHRYLADECGKTKDIDVYERHQVVQFCLIDEDKIIGKALYTTTVEEMEDGGESFKALWDASNQDNRDRNGRTKSGLYRYFMPAYRTLYYNKFGFPDEEKAKEFYLNGRAALEDDPRALASYIRKNPFSIEEAFFSEADTCLYDAMKLNKQIESINWMDEKELYDRGDFVWKNGERDTTVEFVKKSNGKFLVAKEANVFDVGAFNQVRTMGSKKAPLYPHKYKAGVDPFDHSETTSDQRSNGAAYLMRAFDAMDENSEAVLVEYINRPDKAEVFYEDMIKMVHYFGCMILPEDNKVGIIKYFEFRGYERFLYKAPGSNKYGVSASPKTHQQIAELHEYYIQENIHKCKFKNLLLDLLKFNLKKTTKFDAAMAFGYTLMLNNSSRFAVKQEDKQKLYEIRDLFPF